MREYKLTLFLFFLVVMVTEIIAAGPAAAPAKGEPPEIIEFPPGDLDKISGDFSIPCKATGTKPLTWTWKKDGVAHPWRTAAVVDVTADGSLSADYITRLDDGVYQCFVKNAFGETYSRKLKVKVTVVGRFFENENSGPLDVEVTIGRPVIVPCPRHRYSYGQYYSWGAKDLSTSRRISLYETNHRFVTQNGTLVFAWVNASDVIFVNEYGGVSCSIEGGNKIYRSKKIRFKVVGTKFTGYTQPTFYDKPNEVIQGTQGKMVNLYCAALGKPAPSIAWFKDNNIIASGENGIVLKHYNRRFLMKNPGRRNHGNYKCQARNTDPQNGAINTIVHYWQLVIRSTPLWKVKPSNREHIAVGGNVTMTCEAEGYPQPSYTWKKEGTVVSNSAHVKVNGGKLEIIRGREQDSGVYHCDAENQVGNLVSSTWLQVSAVPPAITNFPQNNLDYPSAVVAGHSDRGFELPCKAVGTNPLKWTWKVGRRGKKLVIDGKKFVLKADGTLIGRSLTVKDSNFYQCEVSNKQGTVFSKRIQVRVSATGKFYQNHNQKITQDVTVGQPLEVNCPLRSHSFGHEILWEGLSAKAQTLHSYVVGEGINKGNLVYSYLSRNDLNEAKMNGGLQCVMKSGSITEKSAKVVLNEAGKEVAGDVKPSFAFPVSTLIRAKEGSKKAIPCYVTGKPDATIEWEFNSKKIVDGTNSFLTSLVPAHLVINKVEKSKHEGSYKCTATNTVGTVTSPRIFLRVIPPPKLAIKPKTEEGINVSDNISLQCKVDSGSRRPLSPKWFRNGILVQESARLKLSGGNLTITNAVVKDSGVYQCVAENRIGMVVTATALHVDKTKP